MTINEILSEGSNNKTPILRGAPAQLFGTPEPVEGQYSLLQSLPPTCEGVYEFYSSEVHEHLILLKGDENDGITSEYLAMANNMEVESTLPTLSIGRDAFLVVPKGVRIVEDTIPLLLRNMDSYKDLFQQLGETLRQIDNTGLGLPAPELIMRSFAFAPSADRESGVSLIYIPLQKLDLTIGYEDIAVGVGGRLRDIDLLFEDEVDVVLEELERGWCN